VYTIHTNAKLNLSLIVYKPRTDGYHPICSIFQAISLKDTLKIKLSKKKEIRITSESNVPTGPSNILYAVYNALKERLDFGIHVDLNKNIPMGAGLGGGSSNAAGLLVFLNKSGNLKLPMKEQINIAKKIGADVPFFVSNQGTSLVRGIGEKVSSVTPGKYKAFVLINPKKHLETKTIFRLYDKIGNAKAARKTPNNIIENHLGTNSLKNTVWNAYPLYKELESKLAQQNSPPIYLSGTGATVFMAFTRLENAQTWENKLRTIFIGYDINTVEAVDTCLSYDENMLS
jgi:4-diphosphocytidyl-2-C-methyl-D-erythritol kinase